MEKCFPAIRGNRKLCNRLADEITEGRFPHAYILAGKPGSGKRLLALQISAALACKSRTVLPCGVCESCQKILSGFSPDVISIRKDADKKEFTVNLIRNIKDSLYIAPNELEKRVYILEDTETMNANAQNAFLKMLEEPPSYVVFLLLCANTENLLETVKSRAPILYTEQLSTEDIHAFLLENSTRARDMAANDPQKLMAITTAADGSIGLAMSLCEESEKHAALRQLVLDFLTAWTAPILTDLDLFCDRLCANGDAIEIFLGALKKALRDIAVLKFDFIPEFLFFNSTDEAAPFTERIATAKAIKLSVAADHLTEKLKFYLDTRLAAATFCSDARRIRME